MNQKTNNMRKKKVSIITLFLLIVIGFAMAITVVNYTKKTNALEQEKANIIPGTEVKELIEYENELPDDIKERLELSGDLICYPSGEEYIVAKEGSVINLVYKVTVTGTPGANYTVKDNESEWVGGNLESGVISEDGYAIIYFKKSFEITKDTKSLENIATVTSDTNLVSIGVQKSEPTNSYKLTSIGIERLTSFPAWIGLTDIYTEGDEYAIEKEDILEVIQKGDSVINLLYAVTVTGDEGANYTVKDEGAVYVGGDPESGVISAMGKATIYFTKSFEITEDTDALENIVYVEAGPNTDTMPGATEAYSYIVIPGGGLPPPGGDDFRAMTYRNMNSTDNINALKQTNSSVITGIVKELIEYENELSDDIKEKLELSGDLIYYPEAQGYVSAKEGSIINLVYKVTVTGEEGAKYIVKDNGAEWIGGDLESGVISESGNAIIYFKKSFEITEDTEFLENVATVTYDSNLVIKKVLVQKNLI